jgi:hypothetical protein
MSSSLIIYGRGTIVPRVTSALVLFKEEIRKYIPHDADDYERRAILRDASLVYEALLRVSIRYSFYEALYDGATALLDRYGDRIGEYELQARLRYAMRCCIVASDRLLGSLGHEMRKIPSIVVVRASYRRFGLDPDAMEAISMMNWRAAGWSDWEKTGICFCEKCKAPPFVGGCSKDKTGLLLPEQWSGDDGDYGTSYGRRCH